MQGCYTSTNEFGQYQLVRWGQQGAGLSECVGGYSAVTVLIGSSHDGRMRVSLGFRQE